MEGKSLSILVALQGGGLSGIDTYAEQVAANAAASGHHVVLLAAGEPAAAGVRRRAPAGVDVHSTRQPVGSRIGRFSRKVPTFELAEMRRLLAAELKQLGAQFDVAHLNHPGLAPAVRGHATRVVAGAWFYPHRPAGRIVETWRHTGASFPRSAAFAVKGLAHYLNDRRGYRLCDEVAAPTDILAADLRAQGIPAVTCPPPLLPAGAAGAAQVPKPAGGVRIMVCCGDLGHPRKNVAAGVRAVRILAEHGRQVELVLVGRNASRLETELSALPWSVALHAPGQLPREVIGGWMESSDLLLMPSLYEEWGYVATESLMAGTPVAAFPVYPFAEMLPAPLGACAGNMSPAALAAAAERVLDSGHSRKEVRAEASRRYGAEAAGMRLKALWTGEAPGQSPVAAGLEAAVAR